MRRIEIDFSALKETTPTEYALRALFGGLCTLAAGLVANRYGPVIGGLFLAFPAIFPAGASLIEDHEIDRKKSIGRDGKHRGRMAASLDSEGASLGCFGLMAFAAVLWRQLPGHNAYSVIFSGVVIWGLVSLSLWLLSSSRVVRRLKRLSRNQQSVKTR